MWRWSNGEDSLQVFQRLSESNGISATTSDFLSLNYSAQLGTAKMEKLKIHEIRSADKVLIAMIFPMANQGTPVQYIGNEETYLQVGLMHRGSQDPVRAHKHNEITRMIPRTQEVLILLTGSMNISFFDLQDNPIETVNVVAGHICLLLQGGHGIDFLEDSELIEVKQGPHIGASDRTLL